MLNKISPCATLLSLGLALLLSGSMACKAAPDKAGKAGNPTTATAATAAPASPSAAAAATPPAAAPGELGQPAVPGQPAGPAATGKPGPAAGGPPLPVAKIPEVVALVNGREIKKAELMEGAQTVQIRLAQAGHPVTPSADFFRHVLDELIAITLLEQDAKAQGITASDQEVQHVCDAKKKSFPSDEAYKKALAQAGMTEAKLREQARDQISVQKYVQTQLAPKATVPDQAARDFYEKNKELIKAPERLHLRHILVTVDPKAPPADREKARQKAQDVLKRLQAGEDFAKLAQQYSDDPGSKDRGGDIGVITHGQTVPPFEAAAFALKKPNELSPLVESQYGFHIIQLLERQEAGTLPFEQVKDRIGSMLKQQQIQTLFQTRAGELRAKGKVVVYI